MMVNSLFRRVTFWGFAFLWAVYSVQAHPVKKRSATVGNEAQLETQLQRVKRLDGDSFRELSRVKRWEEVELTRVKRGEIIRDTSELSRTKREERELSRMKRGDMIGDETELSRMKRDEIELSREKRMKRESDQGNSLDVQTGIKHSDEKDDLAVKTSASHKQHKKKRLTKSGKEKFASRSFKHKKNLSSSNQPVKRKMGWWEKRARKRFFHHENDKKIENVSDKHKRNHTKSRRFHKPSHELLRSDKELDDVKHSSNPLAMKKRNSGKNH